jgi:hypothetical protein
MPPQQVRRSGCGLGRSRGGTGRLEHHERLPDLDRLPLFHEHLRDPSARGARHLDHGLVGLDLEQRLARLHHVALGHEDGDDVTGGDVLSEVGQLEFGGHRCSFGWSERDVV